MAGRSRVFYQENPRKVIVEKDGSPIAVYNSVEELVEHHIKGILARDQQDAARARGVYQQKKDKDES